MLKGNKRAAPNEVDTVLGLKATGNVSKWSE